jgi:hypothetical protein
MLLYYAYQYGEVTGYENRYLLTKVTYPTEGHTDYTYGKKEVRFCKDTCNVWNEDCHEVIDCYDRFYQFLVITQKVYADELTRVRTFSYTGNWEDITGSVEKAKDEFVFFFTGKSKSIVMMRSSDGLQWGQRSLVFKWDPYPDFDAAKSGDGTFWIVLEGEDGLYIMHYSDQDYYEDIQWMKTNTLLASLCSQYSHGKRVRYFRERMNLPPLE